MRCVRCFRPLTSPLSINNGMQGATCRKYINAMSPSSRADMYQAFQTKMDKYGEVGQCSRIDYSHLAKGGYEVTTSLYDREEHELIVSYINKQTGEVTSVRFHADEGKPMYDYEKGNVIESVIIGSRRDDEIAQEDAPVQEMRNDFVAIHTGESQQIDLRQDAQDLYQQYKFFEGSQKQILIDRVNFSPNDKSYDLQFVENNVPVKVKVFAKKGKSMGVIPVRYQVEKNGEVTEGFASDNDNQWTALRKDHPIINRVHYDARDTISNHMDMAFTKHKVKWLQAHHPNVAVDKTAQFKGAERGVSVKLAYTHPETKESVLVMDTAEGRQVIRLYKKENPVEGERPYCYSVHGNGTVDEGKLGDSFMRMYQEQSKTVNRLVKDYQLSV